VLEERFRDPAGGYFEGLTEEWATPAAGAGLLVGDPSHKTISTHLNALDALANVHARGYADLTSQISELIELVDVRAILPGSQLMGEIFTRDWSAVVGSPSVSYGHDLERIWMAAGARRAIGAPKAVRGTAFDELVRWGWDRRRGGFYFGGAPGAPARDLRKQWWVQGEALVACLELSARSGSQKGLGFFDRTLGWIETAQADWDACEWHDTIDVHGRPHGEKGWTWKTGYHTTRSLLMALDLLRVAR
jgi:mannose/cellobiose epimerase-like protein (N-acyl-D-glucosamine 2-epimerase family)